MSIRHSLLALLEREPMYGYQLRTEFDATTGSTWPLNVGQVYTTLARLERDGLVRPGEEDAEGRTRYAITEGGRAELAAWFASPVVSTDRPRDELAIKLALAVTVPGVDVGAVVQRQRAATITAMQDLTRLKRVGPGQHEDGDLSWSLVLESMRYQLEAEVRWLDHCEAALSRAARARPARAPDGSAVTGPAVPGQGRATNDSTGAPR
jgi:DNA-binding PadR family transcriptional regulator